MRWRFPGSAGVVMVMAMVMAVSLSGCYEDVTPTNYEPGVYKGESDPLRAKLEHGTVHRQLGERADAAFEDR